MRINELKKQKLPKLWENSKRQEINIDIAQLTIENNKSSFNSAIKSQQYFGSINHYETPWVVPDIVDSNGEDEDQIITDMWYDWTITYQNLPEQWIEAFRVIPQFKRLSQQVLEPIQAEGIQVWTITDTQIEGIKVGILNADIYLVNDEGLPTDIQVRLVIDVQNPNLYT